MECIFLQQMERKKAAHLDPAPEGREEGGSVDDRDCVQRFWIVGGGHFGGLLEVAA